MSSSEIDKQTPAVAKPVLLTIVAMALTSPLAGCMLVGGYSSRGGWFIWPGSLGLLLIAFLIFSFLRKR